MAGNVIMDKAWCRLGIRTVPDMAASKAYTLLENKIRSLASPHARVCITPSSLADPWSTDIRHPAFSLAARALSEGYRQDTVTIGCGGSIPFAGVLSQMLGNIPALLVGVEDPYANAHSENESLLLSDLKKGIRSQIILFDLLSRNAQIFA